MPRRKALEYFNPSHSSDRSISSTFKSKTFGEEAGSSTNLPFRSLDDPQNRDTTKVPTLIEILEFHARDSSLRRFRTADSTSQVPSMPNESRGALCPDGRELGCAGSAANS